MFFIYSKAIKGGGAIVSSTSSGGGTTATSSSGGGTTATSSSGGGVNKSTLSGGETTQTSSFSNPTFFVYSSTKLPLTGATFDNHTHAVEVNDQLNHSHSVSMPAHAHDFSTPNHTHSVTVPNHSHSVSIPNHTHDITLPDHTHAIDYGIYMLDRLPTAVLIKVDGNTVPHTTISGEKINLIPYLANDSEGRVQRGWHTVTITPNDLGRVNAQITTQFFVQSRGGGSY
jgi:hypothetical protein